MYHIIGFFKYFEQCKRLPGRGLPEMLLCNCKLLKTTVVPKVVLIRVLIVYFNTNLLWFPVNKISY